jgi:hypothetical protein
MMSCNFSTYLRWGSALCAVAITLGAGVAGAQTAVRCDVNGKTVYSDAPCQPNAANKAVINTQDTPEQRAAAKAANDQIRKDNLAVDKRLDDRYKRDTATSKTSMQPNRAVLDNDAKPKKARNAKTSTKTKAAKAPKSAKAKAKAKKDNRSSRAKSGA